MDVVSESDYLNKFIFLYFINEKYINYYFLFQKKIELVKYFNFLVL